MKCMGTCVWEHWYYLINLIWLEINSEDTEMIFFRTLCVNNIHWICFVGCIRRTFKHWVLVPPTGSETLAGSNLLQFLPPTHRPCPQPHSMQVVVMHRVQGGGVAMHKGDRPLTTSFLPPESSGSCGGAWITTNFLSKHFHYCHNHSIIFSPEKSYFRHHPNY